MTSTLSLRRADARSAISMLVPLFAVIAWSGCSALRTSPICPQRTSSIVLTALTSPSDIGMSKQAGRVVAEEVARRAANACATLSAAVANAHPEGDLVLTSQELKPAAAAAPNRMPWISQLQRKAEVWLTQRFLHPLRRAIAEPGSPVLTTIVAIATQLRAAGQRHSTIIEITDGFAEEKAPDGGAIDFERHDPALAEHLRSFIPGLRALKGGCVIFVGAGAHTRLGLRHVEEVHSELERVLYAAGVHFAWTRSLTLPTHC